MHYLATVAASFLAAAIGNGPSGAIHKAAEVSDTSEAYVAQLDADWNVVREIRVPCSIDAGCTVDLKLAQGGPTQVHVSFDALRSGRIGVGSVVTDKAGRDLAQPPMTLRIDRGGFGAVHYETGFVKAAARDGVETPNVDTPPIILMAVKVPGWAAALGTPSSDGDRT